MTHCTKKSVVILQQCGEIASDVGSCDLSANQQITRKSCASLLADFGMILVLLPPEDLMFYQHTLKSTAKFSGVGLHTGRTINMEIQPARENTGLVFARKTADGLVEIPAISKNVVETRLATVLAHENGLRISTVEHVLAALAGMEIDNAKVIVDGPEIPILDGSSAPIVEGILRAGGPARQTQARRFLVVRKSVRVFDEESSRWASLEPASGFELDCTIDFDHPLIRNQRIEFEVNATDFISEISGARTFGFAKDVERMRQAGLALGGSLKSYILSSIRLLSVVFQ